MEYWSFGHVLERVYLPNLPEFLYVEARVCGLRGERRRSWKLSPAMQCCGKCQSLQHPPMLESDAHCKVTLAVTEHVLRSW